MILFMLLPIYFICKRHKKRGALISVSIGAFTLIVYVLINRYLQADYIAPLFSTEWIKAFVKQGLFGGLKNLLGTIFLQTKAFAARMRFPERGGFPGRVLYRIQRPHAHLCPAMYRRYPVCAQL